ncbi:hypothetical protein [Methanovulcanius yangii]|uniref:hypothetical protein n=1 Tax=Methanovulcanius yangii TaxID=1789227 RepID=UPI0029C9DD5A|nr:hypothetical protein [Methanovulcanius yangii]
MTDKFQKTRAHMPFALTDPEVPDGAEIVAYGFSIDARGVPVQSVGFAGPDNFRCKGES